LRVRNPILAGLVVALTLCVFERGAAADEPSGGPDSAASLAPVSYSGDEDRFHLYLTGEIGGDFARMSSSGLNTAGAFRNTGADHDDDFFGGGALGVAVDVGPVVVRVEAEGFSERDYRFRTNSFPGPPGPITFFYRGNFEAWTVMGNLWFDYPLNNLWPDLSVVRNLVISAGTGFGAARTQLSMTDGVVRADAKDTNFAWQLGAGLGYAITDWLTLEVSYRHIDLGETSVDMYAVLDGALAGNYDLKVNSEQVMGGLRLTFFSF
jgi:opacity protein-like surface antigen